MKKQQKIFASVCWSLIKKKDRSADRVSKPKMVWGLELYVSGRQQVLHHAFAHDADSNKPNLSQMEHITKSLSLLKGC